MLGKLDTTYQRKNLDIIYAAHKTDEKPSFPHQVPLDRLRTAVIHTKTSLQTSPFSSPFPPRVAWVVNKRPAWTQPRVGLPEAKTPGSPKGTELLSAEKLTREFQMEALRCLRRHSSSQLLLLLLSRFSRVRLCETP